MPQPRKYDNSAARQAAYRTRCQQAHRASLAAKGLPPMPAIPTMPGWKRWNASLAGAREMVWSTLYEMQRYAEDRSDAWQNGERGQEHQERIDALEAVMSALDDLSFP